MNICVVASLLLCYLSNNVEGFCSTESVQTETTVFGTKVKYCHYNGMDILPGSVVRNKAKCEEASCDESGLSVCGIGINAGVIAVEKGRVVVPDGCNPRIVSLNCLPQKPLIRKNGYNKIRP